MRKFDFHVHTRYSSDGHGSPAEMVEAAEARGLEAVAITDHAPEISVGIKPERIPLMFEDVKLAREDSRIWVLLGMEANALGPPGDLDLGGEVIQELDLLVVGVHKLNTLTQDPRELAREYLRVVTSVLERWRFDVLAHPFQFNRYLAPYLKREELEDFVRLMAERGVALEVNLKYRVPDLELLKLCLREGVKLSVGTDAHRAGEVGRVDWPLGMLKRAGAKREDLVLNLVG